MPVDAMSARHTAAAQIFLAMSPLVRFVEALHYLRFRLHNSKQTPGDTSLHGGESKFPLSAAGESSLRFTAQHIKYSSKWVATIEKSARREEAMLTRRSLVTAGAGLALTSSGAFRASAAGIDLPAALPEGARNNAVLDSLPGKKPLIKHTYRPPNYETPLEYFRTAI